MNPVILYRNLLAEATGQPEGGEVFADQDTSTRWEPADLETLTFTGIGGKATHIGIAAHNLDITGGSLLIEYASGAGGWLELATVTAAGAQAELVSVPETAITGLRITSQGEGNTVGLLFIGPVLELQRSFYQGHTPLRFGAQNTRVFKRPAGGQYLGNQIRRRAQGSSVSLKNLTPEWVRTEFEPFRQHYNSGGRFFLAWYPDKYASEVAFCRGAGSIAPTNSGGRGYMSLDFDVTAYIQKRDEVAADAPLDVLLAGTENVKAGSDFVRAL